MPNFYFVYGGGGFDKCEWQNVSWFLDAFKKKIFKIVQPCTVNHIQYNTNACGAGKKWSQNTIAETKAHIFLRETIYTKTKNCINIKQYNPKIKENL